MFADDTLVFINGAKKRSITNLLDFLQLYQRSSGQLVNAHKSGFMLSYKAPARLRTLIANTTGYSYKEFPVKYLGIPLISGKCKKAFFSAIVDKIKILRKVKGWRSSLLSAGGRFIFIKHVLSAIPIYTLASTAIQKGIHSLIEKDFSHFFWGSND